MPESPANWTGAPVNKIRYGKGSLIVTETAKLMYALSEGVCAGFSGDNAWKCIKLDGTPIMSPDGTFNLKGVSAAIVHGTVGQQSIPGFAGVETEHSSGTEITHAVPVTITITDPACTSVRIKIGLQGFQAQNTSTGVINGTSVVMGITVNGVAQALPGIGSAVAGTITGYAPSPTTVSWLIPLTGTGTKTIVISRDTADNHGTYLQNQTYLSGWTEIQDVRMRHPHTAKLAVAFSADTYASLPKVTVVYKGRIVQIPSNYNPTTRVYTGTWDGTFTTGWTDNPAWCLYDMATHPRYGAGRYLAAEGLDKWALYSIAQYCDVLVSDGDGGTEPRFRFNAYFTSDEEAFKVLAHMISTARAMLYYGGSIDRPTTSLTAIQDVDGSVRELFSPSNVINGEFNYEGTSLKTRYTQVVVWWNDPAQAYKLVPVMVQADTAYITRYGVQTAPDITAFGCISQGQAIREGKRVLLTNLLELEGVTFKSGLNGVVLFPGDIIQIQDPCRDLKRMSGRVVAATSTTLTLDAPTVLSPSTAYTLWLELPNGSIVSRPITTAAGTVTSVAWASALSTLPQIEAQWQITPTATAPTKWRILGIKEAKSSDSITYEIRAAERNPDKYALMDDPGTIVPFVGSTPSLLPVTGLSVGYSTSWVDSSSAFLISATWTMPAGAISATARIRRDSGQWLPMNATGAGATFQSTVGGTFEVQVTAVHPNGDSPVTSGSVTVANIVSGNSLTDLEKSFLVQSWNAEQQTKTQLDSQASTYSVSATAYDNAVAALSTGLIAAGAPSGWATSWPDGTTFTSTGIVAALSGWWATIASTRAALDAAIKAKINSGVTDINSADKLTNSDKLQLIQDWVCELQVQAKLNTQASSLGVSATAYGNAITALSTGLVSAGAPSNWASVWPDGTTFSATGIKTSLKGWWSTINQTRTDLENALGSAYVSTAATTALQKSAYTTDGVHIQGTTLAGGTITAAAMANSNSTNLIPNPNSEAPAPSGGWPSGAYEAVGLVNWLARTGSSSRLINGQASLSAVETPIAPLVACSPGDQFFIQGYIYNSNASGSGYLSIHWLTQSGGWVSGSGPAWVGPNGGTWGLSAGAFTAPAGASFMQICLGVNGLNAAQGCGFDDLYCGKVIVAGMLAANSVVAGTVAAQAITAQNLTVANFDNLIPNPNSEQPAPSGGWPSGAWEAVSLVTDTGYNLKPHCRRDYSGTFQQITPFIPCTPGDVFYLECYAHATGAASAVLQFEFWDSSLTWISSTTNVTTSGTYTKLAINPPVAPWNAAFVRVVIKSSAAGSSCYFDCFYLRRCADAQMIVDGTLTALLARVAKAIQSTGYTPGSAGNSPIGFCLSGPAFTTTYDDGTNDTNCHMEMEGNANFGGKRVATVNTRVFGAVNRVSNGFFYRNLAPWATTAGLLAYNTTSSGTGTGSAILTATGTFLAANDSLSQTFISPALQAGQTVTLDFKSGWVTNSTSGLSNSYVKAYIVNLATGVETLLATYNYTHSGQSLAWTSRSVSITSYVSAGGEFGIRLECNVEDNNSTTKTASIYIDEVKVII